jgi:hypothetical protein
MNRMLKLSSASFTRDMLFAVIVKERGENIRVVAGSDLDADRGAISKNVS